MNDSATRNWLILAVLLAAMYGAFTVWRARQHEASAGSGAPSGTAKAPALRHFTLTDQAGKPFDSDSLKGKVWVGSFFFTNCPAICWRMNQALAGLEQSGAAGDASYVSITCDPENDTPPVLAKYAEHFKANPEQWRFLTGDFKLIRQIGNDFFQVAVDKGTHSDRAFLVDRNGRVRGRFRVTEPDQLELLKKLLETVNAEPASPATAEPERSTEATAAADTSSSEAAP